MSDRKTHLTGIYVVIAALIGLAGTLSTIYLKPTRGKSADPSTEPLRHFDDKARLSRILDIKRIPQLEQNHHAMYVEFLLLAKAAQIPEREAKWIMNMVENGLLHNVVQKFSILAIDNSFTPPRIGIELSINFDWKNYKIHPVLNKENYRSSKLENQRTMDLAEAFTEYLRRYEDENTVVDLRCWTIPNPTFQALKTLGAISAATIINQDTVINISKDEFKRIVYKKLNLVEGEPLKWRSGNEFYQYQDSEVTPGLSVTLRYVVPNDSNKKELLD